MELSVSHMPYSNFVKYDKVIGTITKDSSMDKPFNITETITFFL